MACNRSTVNFDTIALWRQGNIVCYLDLGDDETVLLGELLAHLGHAMCQLLLRCDETRRELLAKAKLDLCGFKRGLDGIAFLLIGIPLL